MSKLAPRVAMLLLLLGLLLGAGCVSRVPRLAAGPFEANDPRLFSMAVAVARAHGYNPTLVDGAAGTFEVEARNDRTGETRFVVRCLRDGWIAVTPTGPRFTESEEGFSARRRLGEEYVRLVDWLDDEVER